MSKDEPHIDAGEKINVRQMSFDSVKSLVMQREGYLGDAQSIFNEVNSIQELKDFPTFDGTSVDID